jgi:anti-anti-sigma factor
MTQLTTPGSGMVIFRRDERRGVLRVIGEVDLSNADHFASVIRTEARRTTSVALDVSRLGFMGLDGCHVIRRIARDLHARGGSLRLVDPKPLIRRMFRLVGSDGNPGLEIVETKPVPSRRSDSNRRPSDYKSVQVG